MGGKFSDKMWFCICLCFLHIIRLEMDQKGPNMDKIRAKNSVSVPKITHTLFMATASSNVFIAFFLLFPPYRFGCIHKDWYLMGSRKYIIFLFLIKVSSVSLGYTVVRLLHPCIRFFHSLVYCMLRLVYDGIIASIKTQAFCNFFCTKIFFW